MLVYSILTPQVNRLKLSERQTRHLVVTVSMTRFHTRRISNKTVFVTCTEYNSCRLNTKHLMVKSTPVVFSACVKYN